ncbi:unnamed protein product, partial [Bubo scandiacus]
ANASRLQGGPTAGQGGAHQRWWYYHQSLIILSHKRSLTARNSHDVSDLQLNLKVTKV